MKLFMFSRALVLVAGCLASLYAAAPASAELIYLTTGRTLSVRGHRADGNTMVLLLRTGGQVTCDASLVQRLEPDEIPYPEPPEPAVESSAIAPAEILSVPYGELIDNLSATYGVDPRLVRAVVQVESGYRSRARSRKGAVGLMQVLPATGRQYGARKLLDPKTNLETGIRHLKSLLDRFELKLALAAYNAGENAVKRFGGIPPYRETRSYVSKILSLLRR
jgi:hypothetical protein